MPLTGQTTGTSDLKGCLEEVSTTAERGRDPAAATRSTEGTARMRKSGMGRQKKILGPDLTRMIHLVTDATAQKKGRHEKSTLG